MVWGWDLEATLVFGGYLDMWGGYLDMKVGYLGGNGLGLVVIA